MKSSLLLSAMFAGCLFCMLSCSSDEPARPNPDIDVAQDDTGESSLTFVADEPWTASVSGGWCAVYPSEGDSGEQKLTVSVQPNTSDAPRTAVLSVYMASKQENYTLKQAGRAYIEVEGGPLIQVDAESQRVEVQVNSSMNYTVSAVPGEGTASLAWLTCPASGKKGAALLFRVEANREAAPRSAEITLTGSDGRTSATFTLRQRWVRRIDADKVLDIPDPAFLKLLLERYDRNGNGKITHGEVKTLGSLDCSSAGIASLQGIEYFDALTTLDCSGNRITSLDLSECTALEYLACDHNALTSLRVPGCRDLKQLSAEYNRLTALDLRGNRRLEHVMLDNNPLVTLQVRGCSSLVRLRCSHTNLVTIDLSGCSALRYFSCPESRLAALNTAGCTALEDIFISGNAFKSLFVSGCPRLKTLSCLDMPSLQAVHTESAFPSVTPYGPVPYRYVGAYFHWIYLPYIYVNGVLKSQQVAMDPPM